MTIISAPFHGLYKPTATELGGGDLQARWRGSDIVGLSNGDEISTWNDSSGNGHDATGVVNNTKKPTYRSSDGPNSKPCVRLQINSTGIGGYFTLPNFLTGFTAGHYFAVLKTDIEPAIISKCAPPLGDWGSSFASGDLYPFVTDGKIYDGWGSTVRKSTGADPPALTNWHVYEVRSASGVWSNYFNGSQLFTTGTNTVGWSTAPKIGRTNVNLNTLEGMIAEILFYTAIQSGAGLTAIYDYLESEYTITLP